ncbi:MAG: IS3 family transposase [Actinobacteria bacterium]|nr:IS3 family transposase [Actinomycetota bacterium]
MLTRTIDHYREETKETLVSTCRLFGVNRQVYYRRKRSMQKKQGIACEVVKMVLEVRQQMPRIGTRKLYYLLQEQLKDLGVGRDKLFTILDANKMLIKPRRSYQRTTDSHHRFRKHKNLIQSLTPVRPEQIWASDITYLGNRGSHRYLALVTDTYSKKIVGYDLSTSLGADGAIRALEMGLKHRSYKDHKLIHHSDRGFQYCCDGYQEILVKKKVTCSMTESYDPYANAVAERVNGILKQEFLLEDYNVKLHVMKELVGNSIDIYNKKRPHYSCALNTPEQMHKQSQIKIKTYKKINRSKASLAAVNKTV